MQASTTARSASNAKSVVDMLETIVARGRRDELLSMELSAIELATSSATQNKNIAALRMVSPNPLGPSLRIVKVLRAVMAKRPMLQRSCMPTELRLSLLDFASSIDPRVLEFMGLSEFFGGSMLAFIFACAAL